MLDVRLFRSDPDLVRRGLASRGRPTDVVDRVVELDQARREMVTELDSARALANERSEEIGRRKRAGEDVAGLAEEVRLLRERTRDLEQRLAAVETDIEAALLSIPNLPDPSVPVGADESSNVVVRTVGSIPDFAFTPEVHWDLGPAMGILDFDVAAKLAGSRFSLFYAEGARLERALISFMLDLHTTRHGYTEVSPPFLAQRSVMQGTGQVPALEDDMWRCERSDLYLIPTAEVPLSAMFMGEIVPEERLPARFTAYTPCFRREAGSAGKDTRGLIRRHQFDKVELVWITRPQESADALEQLRQDAEDVLCELELPYRVVELCTGDLGTASSKTYDLEVWMPGMGRYVEISSCSNCKDFQARRCNTRYRPAGGGRPEFAHTLNGSGVAVGRCFAAVLENNQQADRTVRIPEALRPYMGGAAMIAPRADRLL